MFYDHIYTKNVSKPLEAHNFGIIIARMVFFLLESLFLPFYKFCLEVISVIRSVFPWTQISPMSFHTYPVYQAHRVSCDAG